MTLAQHFVDWPRHPVPSCRYMSAGVNLLPHIARHRCAAKPAGRPDHNHAAGLARTALAVASLALATYPAWGGSKHESGVSSHVEPAGRSGGQGGGVHMPGSMGGGGAHIPGSMGGGAHIPGSMGGGAHIPGSMGGGAHIPGSMAAHMPSSAAHHAGAAHNATATAARSHAPAEAERGSRHAADDAGRHAQPEAARQTEHPAIRQDARLGGHGPTNTRGLEAARDAHHEPRPFLRADSQRDLARDHAFIDQHAHDFHTRAVRDFSARELAAWRDGRWRNEWHYGRRGWWWEVDGVWYGYPEPEWPYPEEVAPLVVYDTPFIDGPDLSAAELGTDPAIPPLPPAPAGWFRCGSPNGAFPVVSACGDSWELVPGPSAPG